MKSSDLIRLRALSALTVIYKDVLIGTSFSKGLVSLDNTLKLIELIIELHMDIRMETATGVQLHQLFDGNPEPIMDEVLSSLSRKLLSPMD